MNNDTIYRDFESWIIDDCPINAYGMLHYGNKDDARKVAEVFAFFYQCDFNIAYDVIRKYKQLNVRKNMKQRNVIRLTESELKRVISESVKKVLNEGISHLAHDERNPNPRRMDMLFERQKQIIEYDLKKAGLNIPFAVRNYADWNMAVDIPVSAIKSFSEELVELYGNELAAANPKGSKVFRRFSYEPYQGYKRLSHLYTDDYLNGGMHPETIWKHGDMYQDALKDPNIKWMNRGKESDNDAWFYGSLMPKPRKEYDDLRNEVLAIKAIIEKAGYQVSISHEDFFGRWNDENDDYSHQKFVRFILKSDELSKYRDAQYGTPEHQAEFERENEMERRSEQAYEADWYRRNYGEY